MDCFDFDETLLSENSWEGDLDEGELEVEKILDLRSGRMIHYGRVHRQLLVKLKGYLDPRRVGEPDLRCGSFFQEFESNRLSRSRFEMMQSQESKSDEP